MQLDYHYYVIYHLARLAGFKRADAETIAYASQYVDDATESEPIEPFPDQHFDTVRTAHYNLEAFDWNVQKKIYMPFHFLPNKIRWESPPDFSYITQPAHEDEAELASMLFKDACGENNWRFRLIRLGVALHTVADTFAHFGFSGRHHDENNVGRIWLAKDGGWELKILESYVADIFVPRIGHVEALEYPDWPYLTWRYTNNRGKKKLRNNLDYSLRGVRLIYHFLKTAKSPSTESTDLDDDHPGELNSIRKLLKRKGDLKRRCKRWKDYSSAPGYDRKKWRREALRGNVDWDYMSSSQMQTLKKELKGKTGFDDSRWAYFHRAALKQRSLVTGWLN